MSKHLVGNVSKFTVGNTVRNIPNTSNDVIEVYDKQGNCVKVFHNMKEFWEWATNQKFKHCSAWGCKNHAEHGGHVTDGRNNYIIPLCANCNNPNNTNTYQIKSGVSAPRIF